MGADTFESGPDGEGASVVVVQILREVADQVVNHVVHGVPVEQQK